MGFTPKPARFLGFWTIKNSDERPHRRGIFHLENLMRHSTASAASQLECCSTVCTEIQTSRPLGMVISGMQKNPDVITLQKCPLYGRSQPSSNAAVTCAIIAHNVLQFLHAIIAGFQTCSKMFMRLVLQPMTAFGRITWRSTCVDLHVT